MFTIKGDCSSLNVRQLKSRIEERTAARVVHVVSSANVLNDAQMIGDTELVVAVTAKHVTRLRRDGLSHPAANARMKPGPAPA